MLQTLTRKFERNWEDYGPGAALVKTLAYPFKAVFQRVDYRLYRIDLTKPTEVPSGPFGVEFRFINASDEAAIVQIEHNSEWLRGTLRQRLAEGALCLAAFEGESLLGFNLVSFGQVYMPLVDLHRRFRPDEAWSEQIATMKASRKKGLASQLRFRIFDALRARGIRKFYGGARTENLPSLGLARRVGFQEFVEIRFTCFLRMKRWSYVRVRHERN
jgi:GNAT superfamily N-acetyltransferase